jgi:hypothetical protein
LRCKLQSPQAFVKDFQAKSPRIWMILSIKIILFICIDALLCGELPFIRGTLKGTASRSVLCKISFIGILTNDLPSQLPQR